MRPELTNEQRPYFGLAPVQPEWERIQLSPDRIAFRAGNRLVKQISYVTDEPDKFSEEDYDIQLNPAGDMLPTSGRGKPRPFTLTNLVKYRPTDFRFSFSPTYLIAKHWRCHHEIVRAALPFGSWQQAQPWLAQWMATRPADHFQRLDALRGQRPPQLTYRAGDIVAFTLSNGGYGFCRVLLDVNRLRLTPWLDDAALQGTGSYHYLRRIVATLAIAEVFDLQKAEPTLTVADITQARRWPALVLADEGIRTGLLPIVGHEPVRASDLDDLPQTFEMAYDNGLQGHVFQWGLATATLPADPALMEYEVQVRDQDRQRGVRPFAGPTTEGIFPYPERHFPPFASGSYYALSDMRHPANQDLRHQILERLGLPADISYDDFSRRYGFPTRQELVDWQAAQPASKGWKG